MDDFLSIFQGTFGRLFIVFTWQSLFVLSQLV